MAVIVSAACLTTRGNVVVALSDQTLFIVSDDGKAVRRIELQGARFAPYNAIVERGGKLYLATPQEIYKTKLTNP